MMSDSKNSLTKNKGSKKDGIVDWFRKHKELILWIVVIIGILTLISFVVTLAIIYSKNRANLKIVFGRPANPGEFPYYALVTLSTVRIAHCGGSIIGKMWILTADHCLRSGIRIIASATYLSIPTDNDQTRFVSKVFRHGYSDTNERDFALVQLDEPLQFNSFVQPIFLPTKHDHDLGTFIIVGHGTTEHGVDREILRASKVRIERANEQKMYSKLSKNVKTGPCYGDSGGALVKKNFNESYTIIGVSITATDDCIRGTYESTYSRISFYTDWITETMKNNDNNMNSNADKLAPFDKKNGTKDDNTTENNDKN